MRRAEKSGEASERRSVGAIMCIGVMESWSDGVMGRKRPIDDPPSLGFGEASEDDKSGGSLDCNSDKAVSMRRRHSGWDISSMAESASLRRGGRSSGKA